MKKIAIPVLDGKLGVHFGHVTEFHFFEAEGTEIKEKTVVTPPQHSPGIIPKWVSEQGATEIIAGGMGQMAIDVFNKNGVNVYIGAPIDTPENLVKDFVNGSLKTNENLCDH
ncbi:MAG: NifB/NifX family molybdenum-iron cluster-binding protein [Bacteroidota bacterium]|nr:NifB/NifX family molybdenum-iron cluster-binding protein [Bacteroidota bacterium]